MKAESSTTSTRNFLMGAGAMDVYATGTSGRVASVPRSFSTAETSASSCTGLVKKAAAPSFMARSRCLAPAREVTTMTGMRRVVGLWRNWTMSSYPVMRGISRSVITKWQPCCAGRGLQRPAFAGFGGHHAIQIDEKNQAAIGSDGGAGEKFLAAEIFAEILDDD